MKPHNLLKSNSREPINTKYHEIRRVDKKYVTPHSSAGCTEPPKISQSVEGAEGVPSEDERGREPGTKKI